jgi:N-acetylneuraminic acid mutarotase
MTNKIEKEVLTTKNKQPIKEISYQDVYLLSDTFNQIQSWKETLSVLNNFFGNRVIPLNKKKIIKEFHANSYIFNVFYEDFLIRTDTLERQIEELKTRPKVRI